MSQKKIRAKRKIEEAIQQTLKNRTYHIVLEICKQNQVQFENLDPFEKIRIATLAKRKAEKDLELAMKLENRLTELKAQEAN